MRWITGFYLLLCMLLSGVSRVHADEGMAPNLQISYIGWEKPKPSREKLVEALGKFSECFQKISADLEKEIPKGSSASLRLNYNKLGERIDGHEKVLNQIPKSIIGKVKEEMAFCPLNKSGLGLYRKGELQYPFYALHIFLGRQDVRGSSNLNKKYFHEIIMHLRDKRYTLYNSCPGTAEPTYKVTLDENGVLKDSQMLESSGYKRCDNAFVRAITSSSPYPVPPDDLKRDIRKNGYTFRYGGKDNKPHQK